MRINIHHYHHYDNDRLDLIISKLNKIMKITQEKFDEIVTKLDEITTDIATDYQQLLDENKKLKEELGTLEVSDESFAKHEARIAQLQGLGASVENPVPDPPVE